MRRWSGSMAPSRQQALLRRARTIQRDLRAGMAHLAAQNARLTALSRTALALSDNLDLQHVPCTIVSEAVTALHLKGAALFLPDETYEEYLIRAQHGLEPRLVGTVTARSAELQAGPTSEMPPRSSGPSGDMPEQPQQPRAGLACYEPGCDDNPDWAATLLAACDAGCLALLPIHHKGRLQGVLALLTATRDEWSRAGRMEMATAFAAQVAGPLALAAHLRETELGVAESTFLLQISQLLSSTFDVDAIVSTLAGEASDLMESDVCALYLYDPIEDGVELAAVQGVARAEVVAAGRQRVPLARLPSAARAVAEGRPVSSEWPGEPDLLSLFGPGCQVQAALTVPLRARDSLLGFLFLARRAPRRFSLIETQLGLKLGALAALALDNARLYADLREQMQQVRTAQAQLLEVEKMAALGRIVAGVAHELNNPLAIASGYAQILLDSAVPPEVKSGLDRVDHAVRRAAQVVRDLLAFARQQPILPTAIEVDDLVNTAVERQRSALSSLGIELKVELEPGLPPVRGDRLQLDDVLAQLIDNARRAILTRPGGGVIVIKATCDERVRISVSDNGPGIAPEILDKVFEPFLTTQEVGQGAGLGLAICYGVVRAHGGRIWATNSPSGGAVFHVELPVALPGRAEA